MKWKKDLLKDFGGVVGKPLGSWAYSESVLVDGDAVVCTPGGKEATLLALNKSTGEVIWKSAVPGGAPADYASIAYTNSRWSGAMIKPATTIETIATSCIAGRLRLLNRVVTNLYDAALRPLGVKLSQGNILAVTATLGVARPAEVCDILELDTSTLSRTVDRMVSNGWLEILPDEDGRSHPFRLTDQGKRLMEKAIPAWEKAQAEAKKLLGDNGLRVLDMAIKRSKSAQPK